MIKQGNTMRKTMSKTREDRLKRRQANNEQGDMEVLSKTTDARFKIEIKRLSILRQIII